MLIFNHTSIRLRPADALRALLGRRIHLRTQIEVTNTTEVVGTEQTIGVEPLFPAKKVDGPTSQAQAL